jgi:hypothetical protein
VKVTIIAESHKVLAEAHKGKMMLKDFQCQIIMYHESISEDPIMEEEGYEKMLDVYRRKFILSNLKCKQPKEWANL